MERKVIQIADSTSVVSLPSKWVKKYNIAKGDALNVEERGQSLVISPKITENFVELELDLQNSNEWYIRKLLLIGYIKGADILKIKYNENTTPSYIQKYTKEFKGFTIIEQTKNQLIVKDISNPQTLDIKDLVERVFYLIRELSIKTKETLEDGKIKDLEMIQSLDWNMDSLIFLCLRIINKNGLSDYSKSNSYYSLLTHIEEMGDQYRRMIKNLNEKPYKLNKEMIEAMNKMNSILTKMYYLYKSLDYNKAKEVYLEYKNLGKNIKEIKYKNELEKNIAFNLITIKDIMKLIFSEILILNL